MGKSIKITVRGKVFSLSEAKKLDEDRVKAIFKSYGFTKEKVLNAVFKEMQEAIKKAEPRSKSSTKKKAEPAKKK